MAAGAVPVLPDDLAYPELVGSAWCYERGRFGTALMEAVATIDRRWPEAAGLGATVRRRFDWDVLAPAYDDRLATLARDAGP